METDIPLTEPPAETDDADPAPESAAVAEDPLWVDGTGTSPSVPGPGSAKAWIAGGVAVVVVGAAAAFGVGAAIHTRAAPTVASANGNTTANGGSAPGGSAPGGSAPGGPGGGRPGAAPPGGGTFGSITSIDGAKLTLATADGRSATVLTTAATMVTTSATGAVADIALGDNVTVMGPTTTGAVVAQRITDSGSDASTPGVPGGPGAPGGPGGPVGNSPAGPLAGAVTGLDGSSLTVRTPAGGTVKVTTSSSTAVLVVRSSTLQALEVGQHVLVGGATGSDGVVTATSIRQGGGGFGPPPGAAGEPPPAAGEPPPAAGESGPGSG
jgi:hypothetical protein